MKVAGNWDKINAVQRMQDYILEHYREEITLRDLARAAAFSPWHALRAFTELIGQTPFAYLRAVRLSEAAKMLRDSGASVLDIALSSAFGSHEGFTKAFAREYAMTPRQYRERTPPIRLFCYYSIRSYYKYLEKGECTVSGPIVFTQVIERPARRLILKRGVKATEYFEYCEEVGCDVWGILESIKGALHESIGLWLPASMRKPGTSEYCQGVEMPADFSGEIPAGFDMMDLSPCKYMVFHGEPFEDEAFEEAILQVCEAIKRYDPKHFGWDWAPEDGPRFQLAPIGARGYIEGLPVREYVKK